MTSPRATQWPLTPSLRLAAVALILVIGASLVEGWLAVILWVAAVVFLALAAIKFAKAWRTPSTRS